MSEDKAVYDSMERFRAPLKAEGATLNPETSTGEGRRFCLSLGRSKRDTTWRAKLFTWPELMNKLSAGNETEETQEQYFEWKKAKDPRAESAKDSQGGYLAGTVRDCSRKKSCIVSRSMICLDCDCEDEAIYTVLDIMLENECCWHTTHSHQPKKPRVRIIYPLTRDVSAQEYEAIARKLCEKIGMDLFDSTTAQPERLMFWPSCSKGAEYLFGEHKDKWINPDEFLRENYPSDSWKDFDRLPKFKAEIEGKAAPRRPAGGKLAEAESKKGWIGAFNRAYSLEDAIQAFLSDKYEESSENRWDWLSGASKGGLIGYEDGYCYSFDDTDPIHLAGACCAYDLVRIHKFGSLDQGSKAPVGSRPSDIAMNKLCMSIKEVKAQIAETVMPNDADAFDEAIKKTLEKQSAENDSKADSQTEFIVSGDTTDKKWLKDELVFGEKGALLQRTSNVVYILRHDPMLKGLFRYNVMSQQVEFTRKAPWERISQSPVWDDAHDTYGLSTYMESKGIMTDSAIDAGFRFIQSENSYNPVQEMIESKKWDGVERCETLLIDCLGAEDTATNRYISKLLIMGILMKVYKAPVKFDYTLVLSGAQGTMKSMFCEKLGCQFTSDQEEYNPSKNWYFSLGAKKITDKTYMSLRGKIVVELNEMNIMTSDEVETVKSFLTSTVDRFRLPYGRDDITVNRTCVFIGTTNLTEPFADPSGARRFLIVRVNPSPANRKRLGSMNRNVVQQIYREMYEYLVSINWKANLWQLPDNVAQDQYEMQQETTIEDALTSTFVKWLDEDIPIVWDGKPWDELSPLKRAEWEVKSDEDKAAQFKLTPDNIQKRQKVTYKMIWDECIYVKQFYANENYPIINNRDIIPIRRIMNSLKMQSDWEYKGKIKMLPNGYPPSRGYWRKTIK